MKRSGMKVDSSALLAETITTLADSFDNELFAKTKERLEENWFFVFDASKTVEANIYNFHDMLKLYGSFCRRWEEHHNGSCRVVERVRDQYLWPKIKQFADDLRAMITANRGADPRARRRGAGLPADIRRAQSGPVPCSGAERRGEALDEVSAAIPGDGVAGNKELRGRNSSH